MMTTNIHKWKERMMMGWVHRQKMHFQFILTLVSFRLFRYMYNSLQFYIWFLFFVEGGLRNFVGHLWDGRVFFIIHEFFVINATTTMIHGENTTARYSLFCIQQLQNKSQNINDNGNNNKNNNNGVITYNNFR